jgi:hypothetical protein
MGGQGYGQLSPTPRLLAHSLLSSAAYLGCLGHIVCTAQGLEGRVVQDLALAAQAQVVLADGRGAACSRGAEQEGKSDIC